MNEGHHMTMTNRRIELTCWTVQSQQAGELPDVSNVKREFMVVGYSSLNRAGERSRYALRSKEQE